MEVPNDKQYEYLTSELRYKNNKIIETFLLFIKITIVIITGVFTLDFNIKTDKSIAYASNLLFIIVCISLILLIINNTRSWHGYRKKLSELYPSIPISKSKHFSEILMCIIIIIVCIGFIIYNPLKN